MRSWSDPVPDSDDGSVGCSRSSEVDGLRFAVGEVGHDGHRHGCGTTLSIRRWTPVVSRVGVGQAVLDGLGGPARIADDRLGGSRNLQRQVQTIHPSFVVLFVLFFVPGQQSQSQPAKRLRWRRMP